MSERECEIKLIEEIERHGIAVKTTKWSLNGTERWSATGIAKPPELGGGKWPPRMFEGVGNSEADALKRLGRNLRRVQFNQRSHDTIEPDKEYETNLRRADAEHSLDCPMIPDRKEFSQNMKAMGFEEEYICELIEDQKRGLKIDR